MFVVTVKLAEFSKSVSSLPESCDLFKKGDEASPQVLSPLIPHFTSFKSASW